MKKKIPFEIVKALNKFRGRPMYIIYDKADNWIGRLVYDPKKNRYIVENK